MWSYNEDDTPWNTILLLGGWESRNETLGKKTHILPAQYQNYKSGEIYIIVLFSCATVKTVLFLLWWKGNYKNGETYHYLSNKTTPLISISVLWQGELILCCTSHTHSINIFYQGNVLLFYYCSSSTIILKNRTQ